MGEVCEKCKKPIAEDSLFCPFCGTKRSEKKVLYCNVCKTEYQEGQMFCSKCGSKLGAQVESEVSSAISQFNAQLEVKKQKKNNIPIVVAGAAVAICVIVVILKLGVGGMNFNKKYAGISDEYWCEISDDGSYMRIDTNPYNTEDYVCAEAYEKIEDINRDLGFAASVYVDMGETRGLDGKQSAESSMATVTWRYHPDDGLEVMYTLK